MQLPTRLSSFQQQTEKLFARKLIKDIEFSGSTYQILVEDPDTHHDYWVFLQLQGNEKIGDAFCSCEDGHNLNGCLHLGIAYLSLFNQNGDSLHHRFHASLWYQLCQMYEEMVGSDENVLIQVDNGRYACQFRSEKIIFTIHALSSASVSILENILQNRKLETEETSLKFTNLSAEEILLWREGRPPAQLRFDLSFWSDLAKWWMKMQEEHVPYEIDFNYSKRNLPNWIQINFVDCEIGFYISEANLPLIIPSLNTVKTPFKVKDNFEEGIAEIFYDKKKGELHLVQKKQALHIFENQDDLSKQGIQVGEWTFVPRVGFYPNNPNMLSANTVLSGSELSHALIENASLISRHLHDCLIHSHGISISYRLSFDQKWNFHIRSFIFEAGDLSAGDSRLIGDWAYLDNDGFYPLDDKRFDEVDLMIPHFKVSDFVTQNRAWINNQEGFHTHIKNLEYQISYEISDSKRLTFIKNLAKTEEDSHLHDFGSWVYLREYGFYSKTNSTLNFLFKSGFSLSLEQIPIFIKMNRSELELIPHFFSPICPLINTSLKIELVDKTSLEITPQYELKKEFASNPFFIFDEFIYMKGLGFSEIPLNLRLPEKFRVAHILEGNELNEFLTYELSEIQSYVSSIDRRLLPPQKCQLAVSSVENDLENGKEWYRFKFFYQTEKGAIAVSEFNKALSKKKKTHFIFFDEGRFQLQDSRFDWLKQLPKGRWDKNNETLLLTALEFMRLNAYDPVQFLKSKTSQSSELLYNQLVQFRTPEDPNLTGLVSKLRPYQELGVKWLWFLYSQRMSGLLCDDMGLGKTHQAMALLASVNNFFIQYSAGLKCLFLIVCPTSVIYHWQEKLQHFLPGKRVYIFYGTQRNLEEFQADYDIILTSYGIMRIEKEALSQIQFEVAIFDEIQVAKNQFSQVYAALISLKANMKLGLTGTPIENRLRELKSLFDIVLPAYLPGESNYRELFIKPIEKRNDKKRKIVLHRLITPFTLRRKKEDVLDDLPEKIEEVSYCDLSKDQYALYSDLLEKRRHHLIDELKNGNSPIPYMHIFVLLSSLKQICDHPAVYLKAPNDYLKYHSGKWTLFVELLREARESKQKVVVFSQYLTMIDIIEKYLKQEHIGYASIRGATKNRREQLELFKLDPECEVFVGSLQAAGLGIDLTAGSVVIHYDRWWNAARENQATDRVYRIGQTRGVQVFKLVTKGTFEEKIDAMILQKGRLMEEVVSVDDQSSLKKFTREELISLLELTNENQQLELED